MKKNDVNNKKNRQKDNTVITESAKKTRRLVIIFVSVIVSVALILGATLGIVAAVRNASYVMKLDSVGIDDGVAAYLSGFFKSKYMQALAASGVDVKDTDAFWMTKVYQDNTYGDYLKYETEQYIKQVIASVVIFDTYTKLSKKDKEEISVSVKEILAYKCDGNKKTFNEQASKYGFDYNDFEKATEILYKTYVAKERIFGSQGEKMASFSDYCEEYYKRYIRVKLIFIRTENTFAVDAEGNRIPDTDGNATLRDLTESEKEERKEYIKKLDDCIQGINDGSVAPEQFDALSYELINKYGENSPSSITGYYFNRGSTFTEEFGKYYSDVITASFSLKVGECSVIEFGATAAEETEQNTNSFVGRCYIYCVAPEENAYKKTSDFFADFNLLAATSLYQEMLDEYAKKVEILDKWEEINPVIIPYNSQFIARF